MTALTVHDALDVPCKALQSLVYSGKADGLQQQDSTCCKQVVTC